MTKVSASRLDWGAASAAVQAAGSVAVVGHFNPDADAIGSVAATVAALRQLGHQAIGLVGQPEPFSESLLHIPGSQEILCTTALPKADLVIVVDCGSPSRTGGLQQAIEAFQGEVIVVDHHSTNPLFGSINLVDTAAESTTAVLAKWFEHLGVRLDHDIAYALYAGLASDTAGFRWGRPEMHQLAQRLLEFDLDIAAISAALFDGSTVDEIRMIGHVVSQLELGHAAGIPVAVAIAHYEIIKDSSYAAVEKIVDAIRGTSSAEVAVVFKELHRGFWTVSLRSSSLNVAQVAKSLGGGGHVRAAGYTTQGNPAEITREVFEAIAATKG